MLVSKVILLTFVILKKEESHFCNQIPLALAETYQIRVICD